MLYVNPVLNQGAEKIDSPDRRRLALQEFERLYLREMLKSMRQTLPDGGLFESSQQKQFFEEMLDDALAGRMAASGQIGLAAQIERQWTQQEAALKPDATSAATGLRRRSREGGLPVDDGTVAGLFPVAFPGEGLPVANEQLPANVKDFLREADNNSMR